ncbi:hypothetical protein HYFRA_00008186 [Hymenoscyphus fraxineus]|uniref:Uncharacterized protein n=1 Tax=Hymenoscyphus fraxineus TaxID=746836 RepID=A0A9N9LAE3_9HELO|nr:hypothetical protein HYFRA_00008186 [Hymenoscyphus fraxineus]
MCLKMNKKILQNHMKLLSNCDHHRKTLGEHQKWRDLKGNYNPKTEPVIPAEISLFDVEVTVERDQKVVQCPGGFDSSRLFAKGSDGLWGIRASWKEIPRSQSRVSTRNGVV